MPLIFMCFPTPYTRAVPVLKRRPPCQVPTHPRDFPHMLAPLFNTFPRLPHTVTKLQKSRHWLRRDQRSGFTNPQPTTSSRHPEPALPSSKPIPNRFQQITRVTIQQTKRRPVPANATDLRLGGAVTSCTYGHGHIHSRACARPGAYMHGHSRAHLHRHAHTCTAMAQANSTRPAYGATNPQPTLSSKHPEAALQSSGSIFNPTYSKRLGGMGDDDDAATPATSGGPARLCDRA